MRHMRDLETLDAILAELFELREEALLEESRLEAQLLRVHPEHRAGARNLIHYLAIRRRDVRALQRALARRGLSSLGRMERCCLATLNAVVHAVQSLRACDAPRLEGAPNPTDFDSGDELLSRHANELLGASPERHATRIMVTLHEDTDEDLVFELMRRGMTLARINASKGSPALFERLVASVRTASERSGRECKILFDLAGPNPRTVWLEPGKPKRVAVGDRFAIAAGDSQAKELLASGLRSVIGCTLPQVLRELQPGERILYDDGKIQGTVREVTKLGVMVEVDSTLEERVRLKPHKTLNFPESILGLPALTDKDRADLDFAVGNVDMVGTSFVRTAEDVEELQTELGRRGALDRGLVLKIETSQAFQHFPNLLLTAMQSRHVGVMLARGDMAMELGFERMAEAQEELLWICEAALIPAIWATQVLESLNKTGLPTRGEVTDAAMSSRAECVMLNHGARLPKVVRFLADVLERMQDHQEKKRALLRRLRISVL